MPYALCPIPYALCPIPYALFPTLPHLSEKGYNRCPLHPLNLLKNLLPNFLF